MSNSNFKTEGCIMILSGPSGSGKTSLAKRMVEEDPSIIQSVSVTTRAPRVNEIEGVDYYFTDQNLFSSMVITNQMLEFTELYGNFYGTPRKAVEDRIISGGDLLFDIDYNGAKSIKSKLPEHSFTVFILPPSMEELSNRLLSRAQDSQITIAHRLNAAKEEIRKVKEYDYVIENANLDEALKQLKAILTAERHKKIRITNLDECIESLTTF